MHEKRVKMAMTILRLKNWFHDCAGQGAETWPKVSQWPKTLSSGIVFQELEAWLP
jgi:hypothetical protein